MFAATVVPPEAIAAPVAIPAEVTFFAVCVMLAPLSEGEPLRSPCTRSGIFLMRRYSRRLTTTAWMRTGILPMIPPLEGSCAIFANSSQ